MEISKKYLKYNKIILYIFTINYGDSSMSFLAKTLFSLGTSVTLISSTYAFEFDWDG